MTTVLIPIDGSDCALRAVGLVIAKRARFRRPEEMIIHLVNVQPPLSGDVTRFAGHDQIAAFQREEGEKILQPARDLLDAAAVPYTCHFEVGRVPEKITDLAGRLGCDQIVMGVTGHGALTELLVGSMTLKIVNLAPCPVLLVK